MKTNPLISFCIATYKRPEFLTNTISSILKQEYPHIEIIVSDNDPEGSSEIIVNSFKSKKIHYYKNKRNLGMVKNFNAAFAKAKGDFITFVADDDPVEKDMLKTLIPLYHKYPDCDSFFGACNVYIPDEKTAEIYGFKKGLISLKTTMKKNNEVTLYTPDTFLKKFFTYQVLSYFLWSTGFVKKELVKKIGGMPDYGSPFLTDYTYICLAGTLGKMVIINKELGRQTIHMGNYGRTEENIKTLPQAAHGLDNLLKPFIEKYHVQKQYHTFLSNWIIDHLTGINTFYKKQNIPVNKRLLITTYNTISKNLPFFKKRKLEFLTKLNHPSIAIPFWKTTEKIKRKLKIA